ncbi:hypothetical protein D1604_10260 [Brevundimonas sp. LPMIX5]|uniref:helix-turn-helix domain-containing protein n=1 Tax=Brevundimonas sp. LPMIX5 TaxID=2305887 RepID=UPI000E6686A3|nr:hypothetical protein [Brevundimonas sp. LPMIX5]RIJ65905.1 hypothetical protein D1604_10260 [Brevundimonas sp. LPMIX5]
MTDFSGKLANLPQEERSTILADMVEKMARERAMEIAGRLLDIHPALVENYFVKARLRAALEDHDLREDVAIPDLSPDDIRGIRKAISRSLKDFQSKFGIPARTMEGWEQGRRKPDAVALILLRIIEADPSAVRNALTGRMGTSPIVR